MDVEAVEIRILGCLLEKQRTTPDVYPLSLNGLRAACNQSSNRDPVVDYDEATIRPALERLKVRGWVRLTSGHGSRALKYRHLLDAALGLTDPEQAVLCVLMLRGPQTPGELKGRTERLHPIASLAEVHETLDGLIERELAVRMPRRPGQKEQRYAHLLGADEAEGESAEREAGADDDVEARLRRLEDEVASLRQAVDSLTGADESREAASASFDSGAITTGSEASATGSSNENVEP